LLRLGLLLGLAKSQAGIDQLKPEGLHKVEPGSMANDLLIMILMILLRPTYVNTAGGTKYPNMQALICNYYWSRNEKYNNTLQHFSGTSGLMHVIRTAKS
jgi:hypothetical protein